MKATKPLTAVAALGFILFCGAMAAHAQGPANLQYTPSPTVSPYLNLFTNPNAVGNYQLNVQPLIEQNDFNARQSEAINQLQNQLNQVRSTSGLGATGASRTIRPTGHAAVYMDGSHFYQRLR